MIAPDLERAWLDLNEELHANTLRTTDRHFTLFMIPHNPSIPCRVTVDGTPIDADLSKTSDPSRASKREHCVADAATFALSLRRSRR
jgi:hypothetical protein